MCGTMVSHICHVNRFLFTAFSGTVWCTYSWVWISEKAFLLTVMQTFIEQLGRWGWEREEERERLVHRITSSRFRMKKTIETVIFSFIFTVTSYFFPLTWLFIVRGFQTVGSHLEINRKALSSVGMKGNWRAGEIKICFPSIPEVTGGTFSWATSGSQIWNLFPNWVRFREKDK